MMWKSIVAGMALSAMLCLPAAAQAIPALHDALPEAYKDGIKVAVFNDWAPDEFVDADGKLQK